jgi:transcription elongation factor Elf1
MISSKGSPPPISKKEKERYINSPHHCPHCNSDEILGDAIETDFNIATQPITCTACGRKWVDIYRLVDVEDSR